MTETDNQTVITYLGMIQTEIDRMATTSAIMKGFAATIMAGVSAISMNETAQWQLICAFAPLIFFCVLDMYYLKLERRYRYLFDQVRRGEHETDFDLCPPSTLRDIRAAGAQWWDVLSSKSIWMFYLPLLVIAAIIVLH